MGEEKERRFGTFETISVTDEGDAVVISINRPGVLNALNAAVLHEMAFALDAVERSLPPVLIFTGQGQKAFVGGADIAAMENLSPEEGAEFSSFGQELFLRIERLPVPTIAAVNGFALGGGNELAMACDIRVASKNARFGQPEVGLGITPGFGGTQRLARLCGLSRALDLTLTGSIVDVDEAFRIGLVDRVVPEGEALSAALALAKEIGKKSPVALRLSKKAIRSGWDLRLEDGLLLERRLFSECFRELDQKEGMRSFLEKRAPKYRPKN